MNPFADRFDDRLEPIGITVGVVLVLVGLSTVAGMPWTVKSTPAAAIQTLGALGTLAIGVGLASLSWTGSE